MRTVLPVVTSLLGFLVGCIDYSAEDGSVSSRDSLLVNAGPACSGPPGLYESGSCENLAPGVRRYAPRFELWSDGAAKERFIYLPTNAKIDTSNPDRWAFPVGTRLYKTFSKDGMRVETRLFEKRTAGSGIEHWKYLSYAWNSDQRTVAPAPASGVQDALGTTHDIPSQASCPYCHKQGDGLDPINSFEAIQLNHTASGMTLRTLLQEGTLVNVRGAEPNVSLANATIPGNDVMQRGLGYLHGNCSHCHGGPRPLMGFRLDLVVGATGFADLPIATSAQGKALFNWRGTNPAGEPYVVRLDPGHPESSGIIGRMGVRGRGQQMPPFGTAVVDMQGLHDVWSFIEALPRDGSL